MPTITLQVGQCGNQVGQVLFERLVAQSAATADRAADSELFRWSADGRRRARCLLVDTEPKVVGAVLAADREGLFSREQCYMGQSGRGNNWAFGYNQLHIASQVSGGGGAARPASRAAGGGGPTALGPAWVSSTATEDPSQQEFRILDQLYDGIRREAEEADGCPNFLLIHSLAGGSGSGMGSRILEHLRGSYPLAYIAAASVAPRAAGDTPMQSLNSVMALSFLQAYADVVTLFSNQDLMDACQRPSVAAQLPGGAGSGGMADINRLVAHNLTGLLWPLEGSDALRGAGRIRDVVGTVAADPCTKLLETWTVHSHPNVAVTGLWADSLRSLASLTPRADPLRSNAPITTAGAMLLARGYPAAAVPSKDTGGAYSALLGAYVKSLGPQGAAPTLVSETNLLLRCGQPGLVRSDARKAAAGPTSSSTSLSTATGPSSSSSKTTGGSSSVPPGPSLTVVSNRSSVVGLLEGTVQRALALCDAKAYLHWYARHGCSAEAVREAAHTLLDVAGCYRQLHRLSYDA